MRTKVQTLFESSEIASRFDEKQKIVLHCGDTIDFLQTLPDETAKLIITSPLNYQF